MLFGFVCTTSLVVPSKYFQLKGLIKYPTTLLSTTGCSSFNVTTDAFSTFANISAKAVNSVQPNSIFKISFYYYPLFGATATVIFGLVISYMSKETFLVDRDLISPVAQFCLPEESGRNEEECSDGEEASHILDETKC